jgi:hypothetical protein
MEEGQRSVKLYMPRRYVDLVKNDAINLVYADAQLFTPKYKSWFSKAVKENGTGLVLAGQSYGGNCWLWEWIDSTLGEVLPLEDSTTSGGNMGLVKDPATIRVLEPDNPLMASLPWSKIGKHGTFSGYSLTNAKPGSDVLAELKPVIGQAYPFLVCWDVGRGRSLAILTGLFYPYRNSQDPFYEWLYLGDFACNYNLFVARRDIPEDVQVIHEIRIQTTFAQEVRSILLGGIEFISKLGGNSVSLEEMLREADNTLRDAKQMYLNYEFEASLAKTRKFSQYLIEISEATAKLKDQTFLWIYMVEWSILTATSLTTGAVIWSLMIKKRLYQEVSTTRLTRMTGEPSAPPTLRGDT